MEVAISQGIIKCISTDTIRQVMRTYDNDPALSRSSYSGTGDVVAEWKETCTVLEKSIKNVVEDSLRRGTSLVLEGVHIIPSNDLLDTWTSNGGVAIGCVLSIPDEEVHRRVLSYRGEQTKKGATQQLENFSRIRKIHDEMVCLGKANNWLIIEQKPILEPRPIDLLNNQLQAIWIEGNSQKLLRNIPSFSGQQSWQI